MHNFYLTWLFDFLTQELIRIIASFCTCQVHLRGVQLHFFQLFIYLLYWQNISLCYAINLFPHAPPKVNNYNFLFLRGAPKRWSALFLHLFIYLRVVVGCIFIHLFVYLLEQQNDSPIALLSFYCTLHHLRWHQCQCYLTPLEVCFQF